MMHGEMTTFPMMQPGVVVVVVVRCVGKKDCMSRDALGRPVAEIEPEDAFWV